MAPHPYFLITDNQPAARIDGAEDSVAESDVIDPSSPPSVQIPFIGDGAEYGGYILPPVRIGDDLVLVDARKYFEAMQFEKDVLNLLQDQEGDEPLWESPLNPFIGKSQGQMVQALAISDEKDQAATADLPRPDDSESKGTALELDGAWVPHYDGVDSITHSMPGIKTVIAKGEPAPLYVTQGTDIFAEIAMPTIEDFQDTVPQQAPLSSAADQTKQKDFIEPEHFNIYARNFVDANNPTLPLIGKSEAQIAQAGGLMNAAGALNPQPAEANIGGETSKAVDTPLEPPHDTYQAGEYDPFLDVPVERASGDGRGDYFDSADSLLQPRHLIVDPAELVHAVGQQQQQGGQEHSLGLLPSLPPRIIAMKDPSLMYGPFILIGLIALLYFVLAGVIWVRRGRQRILNGAIYMPV